MKKIILIILLIVCGRESYSQGCIANLQKYWWYRYQLVNDFMKIGDLCGESIPANTRHLDAGDFPNNKQSIGGHLHWGDATISLGQYLLTLATEYKLLRLSGLSTRRTEFEIYYALKAFDRLDRYAEAHCRNFAATQNCGAIEPVLGDNTNNPYATDLNGFFIRDDVPDSFVRSDLRHFNRPKVKNPVNGEMGDMINRIDYLITGAGGNAVAWQTVHPNVPRYPVEMSQDQVVEIYSGLAMLVEILSNASYNNQDLRELAKSELWRVSNYCAFPGPGLWRICNPLTLKCVYGVGPDQYNTGAQCSQGGALVFPSAMGIAKGLTQLDAGWDASMQPKVQGLNALAIPYWAFYQATKGIYLPDIQGDQFLFPTTFDAYAKEWRLLWLGGVNVSRSAIISQSAQYKLRWPHLPLIYRIIHGGNLFRPWRAPWRQKGYDSMLDEAPSCGLYNYHGNYPNWEWSSPNRLAESYKRGETGANGDLVGLSYMALHNLVVINDHGYLSKINNPYYVEDFSHEFPATVNGNLVGNNSQPYVYNTLEYLSTESKIKTGGNVTFRNAKTIDLLPGFEVQQGATFLGYIADYDCSGTISNLNNGRVVDAGDPFVMDTLFMNPIDPYPFPVSEEADYEPSPDELKQDSLLIARQIMQSEDEEAKQWYLNSVGQGSGIVRKVIQPVNAENITVYPNPSNGLFSVLTNGDHYKLRVFTMNGVQILEKEVTEKNVPIDISQYPRGVYIIKIISERQTDCIPVVIQ